MVTAILTIVGMIVFNFAYGAGVPHENNKSSVRKYQPLYHTW